MGAVLTREALADAALAALHEAHPGVQLAREVAVARLSAIELVEGARLGDLCLVWAYLAGDREAARVIDRAIRAEAERVTRELRQPAWLVDEVAQELAKRLLVGDGRGAEPRLATYTGASVLGRWLGVAAMRTALNLARRDRRQAPLSDDAVVAARLEVRPPPAPELAIVRERYRDAVAAAIRAAFAALDNPRDRNLLRLYYVERIGLDQLGRMFNVHASTVSRWLAAVREALFEDTTARLGEQLGMVGAFADLESLIRAVRSELDVSLSQLAP